MIDLLVVVVALIVAGWLVLVSLDWWRMGDYYRRVAASVLASLPEWRGRIEEARAHLADMQTPGWYDRQWPICDDLDLSSDGEYCRRCFRQAHEHGVRVCE